MDQIRVRT